MFRGLLRRLVHGTQRTAPERGSEAVAAFAEAHRLQSAGEHAAALARYGALLERFPDDLALNVNVGGLLIDLDRPEEALAYLDRAARIAPDEPLVDEHRGRACALLQRYGEAEAAERRLLRAHPDEVAAHFRLAHALLARGALAEGWAEYEWRLREPGFAWGVRGLPRWDGCAPQGRRLLVIAEQGLGDAIMFARFVPRLAAQGAQVTLLYRPPLAPLFRSSFAHLGVAVTTEAAGPTGDLQAHIHLLSLPHVLGVGRADLRAEGAYLAPDPALAARWRAALAPYGGLRVGLMWGGNPDMPRDRLRSIPLAAAARFASARDGITWFSLLADNERKRSLPLPFPMVDLPWADFGDTVVLIEALDLVVSVDTSVAHATGALGRPLWLLAQFEPGWRWMIAGEPSPWYRGVRMFRPARIGDWEPVVAAVCDALRERVQAMR